MKLEGFCGSIDTRTTAGMDLPFRYHRRPAVGKRMAGGRNVFRNLVVAGADAASLHDLSAGAVAAPARSVP